MPLDLGTDPGAARANIHVGMLAAVRVVATSNIASLSGLPTIDGVALAAGDRVLLAGQTTASQNGPWIVASGAWSRPSDFQSGSSVKTRSVLVNEGTAAAGQTYRLLSTAGVTVDTSAQAWARDPGLVLLESGGATPNTQTADYTLVLADAGKAVEINSATARAVTVPPNSAVAFLIGTIIEVCRYGTGAVTVTPGAGVTLPNSVEAAGTSNRQIANQMSTVSLRKRATNEWVLVGDII